MFTWSCLASRYSHVNINTIVVFLVHPHVSFRNMKKGIPLSLRRSRDKGIFIQVINLVTCVDTQNTRMQESK